MRAARTAIAANIVSVILPILIVAAARADTIFFDTFSDGDAQDGMPATWVLNSFPDPRFPPGTLVSAATEDLNLAGVAVAEGFPVIQDTSIRTQITLSSPVGNELTFIGVQARRNDETDDGYSAAIGVDNRAAIIVRETGGSILQQSAPVVPDVTQEDVLLQFDALGDTLSLWAWRPDEPMPAEPLITTTDATHPVGVLSLFSVTFGGPNPVGIFRYVHVADHPIRDGDATDDGRIDLEDLNAVRNNFGAGDGSTWGIPGDTVPFDGIVDLTDLNNVRNNFGAGVAAAPARPVPGARRPWDAKQTRDNEPQTGRGNVARRGGDAKTKQPKKPREGRREFPPPLSGRKWESRMRFVPGACATRLHDAAPPGRNCAGFSYVDCG